MEKIINHDSKEYITLLKYPFLEEAIEIIRKPEKYINKPTRAFWGSPVDANYGWKDWILAEDYDVKEYKYSINYTLKDGARVFEVGNLDDIEYLVDKEYMIHTCDEERSIYWDWYIDYENIPYDAVELTDACIGHMFIDRHEMAFNGWDCESICILNPDIILFK